MTTAKLIAIEVNKKLTSANIHEDIKIGWICEELAKMFGARKASRMLTIDRDLLDDCFNELFGF